ncbi:GIY-YIG nuclease family protein [Rhodovibrio sodomensis]|uniref:GIY-YIG nuclease family protein n=1 Tax=Rhodovibrio sodomensis TaxID=1088 RepID=UPI00190403C8
MTVHVYILRCADGSYYVGSAQQGLDRRLAEHRQGVAAGYTAWRRPVELVYSAAFETITDALAAERKLKGWSRAKKEALIGGDFDALPSLARSSQRKNKDSSSE